MNTDKPKSTPEKRAGKIPLKRLVLWFLKFCLFMVIWCGGCAFADYKLNLESNAYIMLWGYMVGSVALFVSGIWGRPQ